MNIRVYTALVFCFSVLIFSCNRQAWKGDDKQSFVLGKIVNENNLLYYHVDGKPYDLLIIAVFKDDSKIEWYRYENRRKKKGGVLSHELYKNVTITEQINNYFKIEVDSVFDEAELNVLDGVELGARVSTPNTISIYYNFVNQKSFFSRFSNNNLIQIFKQVLQINNIEFD